MPSMMSLQKSPYAAEPTHESCQGTRQQQEKGNRLNISNRKEELRDSF